MVFTGTYGTSFSIIDRPLPSDVFFHLLPSVFVVFPYFPFHVQVPFPSCKQKQSHCRSSCNEQNVQVFVICDHFRVRIALMKQQLVIDVEGYQFVLDDSDGQIF